LEINVKLLDNCSSLAHVQILNNFHLTSITRINAGRPRSCDCRILNAEGPVDIPHNTKCVGLQVRQDRSIVLSHQYSYRKRSASLTLPKEPLNELFLKEHYRVPLSAKSKMLLLGVVVSWRVADVAFGSMQHDYTRHASAERVISFIIIGVGFVISAHSVHFPYASVIKATGIRALHLAPVVTLTNPVHDPDTL
jgi:hypothetical protein